MRAAGNDEGGRLTMVVLRCYSTDWASVKPDITIIGIVSEELDIAVDIPAIVEAVGRESQIRWGGSFAIEAHLSRMFARGAGRYATGWTVTAAEQLHYNETDGQYYSFSALGG